MSDNILKMEYPEADQMIATLKAACDQLRDTITDVEGIATALEGGAMQGDAGERFAEGIRGKLVSSLNNLITAFEDGARYVGMERDDMMAAEKKSAELF